MEVDYTEKLNFSDDEENQAAKEKGENWWVIKISPLLVIIASFYFLKYLEFTAQFPHLTNEGPEMVAADLS